MTIEQAIAIGGAMVLERMAIIVEFAALDRL